MAKRIIAGYQVKDYKTETVVALQREMEIKAWEPYAHIIAEEMAKYNDEKMKKTTMCLKLPRCSSKETTQRFSHERRAGRIAKEVAKSLGLNETLVEIAANNHDLGHTPYGHSVEWWETEIFQDMGLGARTHNAIGVRRLLYAGDFEETVMARVEKENPSLSKAQRKRLQETLWLYLDPILSHNGEGSKDELLVKPNLKKTKKGFEQEIINCYTIEGYDREIVPATIEGSLFRIVDIISYVGYDMADGLRENILKNGLDEEYRKILQGFGITNKQIDECLKKKEYTKLGEMVEKAATRNLIRNSNKHEIKMSKEMVQRVLDLKNKNNREIVNKVVRPTENTVFPKAIKQMLEEYSAILQEDNILERLENKHTRKQAMEELQQKYKGTPYEGFVQHITTMKKKDFAYSMKVALHTAKQSAREELDLALEAIENPKVLEKLEQDKEKYPKKYARVEKIRKDIKTRFQDGMTEKQKMVYCNSTVQYARTHQEEDPNVITLIDRLRLEVGARIH